MSRPPPTLQFLRVFWVQQMVSLPIFGVVAGLITSDRPPQTEALLFYGLAFGGLAAMLLAGGLIIRTLKAGTHALPFLMHTPSGNWQNGLSQPQIDQAKRESMLLYKTVTIMGTACAEAAALCGFGLVMMTNMPILYVPFAGASGVIILWQFPHQDGLEVIRHTWVQKKIKEQG